MSQSPNSDLSTDGIRVQAAATWLPEKSDPEVPRYFFMYRIKLSNDGSRTVKLLSRHWVIRDAYNEREDVRGPGVVGNYPVLAPGESYEYTSSCPLNTRWGTMEGSYQFEDCSTGELLKVTIGRFFLVPGSRPREVSAER